MAGDEGRLDWDVESIFEECDKAMAECVEASQMFDRKMKECSERVEALVQRREAMKESVEVAKGAVKAMKVSDESLAKALESLKKSIEAMKETSEPHKGHASGLTLTNVQTTISNHSKSEGCPRVSQAGYT